MQALGVGKLSVKFGKECGELGEGRGLGAGGEAGIVCEDRADADENGVVESAEKVGELEGVFAGDCGARARGGC